MEQRRILIRAGRPPHQPVPLEAAHAYRGVGTISTNPGNLLFQDAVYRTLATPDTHLVVDSLSTERRGMTRAHIARINDEFDVFVVPLANAFRDDFVQPLRRLTDVIEQLNIPVVVTGVGGQLPLDGDPSVAGSEVDEATIAFVRAVLERSESLGVRGDLTKGYLVHLGFPEDRIDIIGCPSMHLAGPDAVVTRPAQPLTADARVAINLTPAVPWARTFLERNHEGFANLAYLPQDQETLGLLLWGEEFSAPPGMPGSLDHPICREDKIRYFVETVPWLRFLAECDFACGTRLHGNVAALMAGTPAYLLAHDSRTLELAQFHQLPYESVPDDAAHDPAWYDAAALYERTNLSAFNAARRPNYERWLAFLDRNGLDHGAPGLNPEYEALVASAAYPPPARALTAATPDELVSRLRWLRQGLPGDALRTHGAYQPEFVPEPARQLNAAERINQVRSQLSEHKTAAHQQQTQLEKKLQSTLREQAKQIKGLERSLAAHQRHLEVLLRPTFTKRVLRRLKREARRFTGLFRRNDNSSLNR